ncbi:MAG: hypothetical protein Q9202_001736 [Teloschistes flavicans]
MPDCTLAELSEVHECEAVIGYKFKDPSLLFRALQPDHALCDIRPKTCRYHGESKKNLALLGMKVVDLLLADRWYRTALDKMKRNIERGMWSVAGGGEHEWQLWRFMTEEPKEGYLPGEMEETLCYGIVGAIYFDGGMEGARGFVEKFYIDMKDGYVWP